MTDIYDVILTNVSFSYSGRSVLENVNLNIKHGDFISIVGPNGGGKTTLLKILLGLLRPDKGKVRIFNNTPKKARLRVGYMPQYAYLDMQFPVSVMDVVLMGRLGTHPGGRYSKQDKKIAESALKEVKLDNLQTRPFNELSGGQRQRVLISRALCCEPNMLLLDEPTANIDPEIEKTLFDILKDLNRRMTILMVSHDLGFVSQIVKSVICVNRKVVVHPTSKINGTVINKIYGEDLHMIRHDHRCSEKGHQYD